MDANAKPTPKPRLRWFQYRLRTLLILMTAFALWFGTLAKRANDQKRAVAAIKAAGGTVAYDYECQDGELKRDAKPPGPVWLRKLLGDDYFVTAIGAGFANCSNDGRELDPLHGIQHVKIIFVFSAATDETLMKLRSFPDLEDLSILGCGITDAGLAELESLAELRSLWISACEGVTDAGLRHLKALHHLKRLVVNGKGVTATGLADLRRALPNTNVSDDDGP